MNESVIKERIAKLEEEVKEKSGMINKFRAEIDKYTTEAIASQGAIRELKKLIGGEANGGLNNNDNNTGQSEK